AYYLYATGYKELDICLGKKLRTMQQGKGCQRHRGTQCKAISAAELRISRLLRDSDLTVMPLALADDGYISPDAHPIARQMTFDIQDLLTYDTAEPLDLLDWKGNAIALFTDPEIAEAFCGIDVGIVRAAYLPRAVAPPGASAELPSELAPSDEAELFV
ncbi:unnamed protein product, partial [Prorocentrum cordatum]